MKTIRARLTFVILGLALLGSASVFVLSQWVASDLTETALHREVTNAKQQLKAKIAAESRQALLLAKVVAGQTGVQDKFAARDRDGLAAEFVSGFAELKADFGIRQFQFHLAPAQSFLRVHKPEKFGDDLSGFRNTVVETNTRGAVISGLEKGVAGIGNRGVVPITRDGIQLGSVEFGLGFHDLFVSDFTSQTGYPLAILRDGESGAEVIGSQLPEGMDPLALVDATANGGIVDASGRFFVDRVAIEDFSGNPIATGIIGVDQSAYQAIAGSARTLGIGVSLFLLAIAAGTLVFASCCIFSPLRTVTSQIMELAEGNAGLDIKGTARPDEVGDIARAVSVCCQNRKEQDRLEGQQASDRASRQRSQEQVRALIEGFKATSQDLLSAVDRANASLEATAGSLDQVAASSAGQAKKAAGASHDASENVQSIASGTEELASSIHEISQQIGRTTDIVTQATDGVCATNDKIAGLAISASKIGEVVTLIRAIAEQTNLLALNATIEAARAGEAGKGFAVVAAEVKELATQTSKATEEISSQIAEIQSSTDDAVKAIGAIAGTMSEVNQYTGAIAASVVQQGAATNEINANVQNAASRTQSVVASIGELDNAVGETTRSAASVLGATREAFESTGRLRTEIQTFLKGVTAA
jgi:methyl-accepting chemotaxis protein